MPSVDASHRPTSQQRPVLLIVYHTHTGGAQQMAHAAAAGARQEDVVEVRLRAATTAGPSDVLQADGYLWACPENLAAISGGMKDFWDRSYYPVLTQLTTMAGKPYASLVCAGSDGHNAARQLARIATGWRLRPVADPLIVCTHAQTPEAIAAPKQLSPAMLAPCTALGAAMAQGLALGIF